MNRSSCVRRVVVVHGSTRNVLGLGANAIAAIVACAALLSAAAATAAPKLLAVHPPGGQIGKEVELKITAGEDLDDVTELRFSHPGIKAIAIQSKDDKKSKGKSSKTAGYRVSIGSDVPAGVYELRLQGKTGVSNARRFVVGTLPETIETDKNETPAAASEISVNSVVNGVADTYDYFHFTAKQGQRLWIGCQAEQIDSKLDGILVLYDSEGRELAQSRKHTGNDPLIAFAAPADGQYLVRVSDFLHRSGPEYFYRLTVSEGPRIELIDPPVAKPGVSGEFTVYGYNLGDGSQSSQIQIDGQPLEQRTVTIAAPESAAEQAAMDLAMQPSEAAVDFFTYRLATSQGVSNPVRIALSNEKLVVEKEANDSPQSAETLAPPLEFVGRFNREGDQDWVQFQAKQGDTFWIEVISNRMGVETDPYLLIQHAGESGKAGGAAIAKDVHEVHEQMSPDGKVTGAKRRPKKGEPTPSTHDDPGFLFTAKADGQYRLMVRDLYAAGDPRMAYRLVIRKARPDFRLLAYPVDVAEYKSKDKNKSKKKGKGDSAPWAASVAPGELRPIRVEALRTEGFLGEIELKVENLPPGVKAEPAKVEKGADFGLVVLRADPGAKPWAGPIRIVGSADIAGDSVSRTARPAEARFKPAKNESPEIVVRGELIFSVAESAAGDAGKKKK